MIGSIFEKVYAEQYDTLYGEKNYEGECDLLEKIFKQWGVQDVHSILDLGCGTGNHAIPLARRGYAVTGVDLSANMLTVAQQKTDRLDWKENGPPKYLQGDLRSLNVNKTFDAVLMMFAVLGYQYSNTNVLEAFRVARRHLRPRGLFIFDVWYGPAVLAIRPGDRIKVISTPEGQLIRAASGNLDVQKHLCEVHYHLWRLAGDRVLSMTEEAHLMRFFFPMELEGLLSICGFNIQSLSAFPTLDECADETTWNALIVAN